MIRNLRLWAAAAVLGLATQAFAALEGPLASAAWLQKNLGREDLLVIDASFAKVHAGGHIPGAVNVDLFAFGGNLVPAAEMERRLRAWGIDSRRDVVVYDPGGTYLATSLAFDLVHRHDLGRLVTATYPLERYEDALAHAAEAGRRGAVKVAFDLREAKERDRLPQ